MNLYSYIDNSEGYAEPAFCVRAHSITEADEVAAKWFGNHPSKLPHISCSIEFSELPPPVDVSKLTTEFSKALTSVGYIH